MRLRLGEGGEEKSSKTSSYKRWYFFLGGTSGEGACEFLRIVVQHAKTYQLPAD